MSFLLAFARHDEGVTAMVPVEMQCSHCRPGAAGMAWVDARDPRHPEEGRSIGFLIDHEGDRLLAVTECRSYDLCSGCTSPPDGRP